MSSRKCDDITKGIIFASTKSLFIMADIKATGRKSSLEISKALVGRTINLARYLTKEESADMMWDHDDYGILIELDNGTQVIVSRDAEGNGAGRLFLSFSDEKQTTV